MPSKDERVIVVDPRLIHQRMLHYKERHQGWHIFWSVYWSAYFIIIGLLLVYYNDINFTLNLFMGTAFMIFAVMLILYGLTEALHHKLMKKYG